MYVSYDIIIPVFYRYIFIYNKEVKWTKRC